MVLASVIGDIGQSLREAFFMFWATLWALILGFALSGAVQAFVAKEEMEKVLGDHRAGAVARASAFGMVSSSCSYAATAMAKSLFQKGADFVSAMIFMFASTNLVIELGIVLLALMGWQFLAAEFIGGPIMIVLLALTGGFVLRGAHIARARRRLQQGIVGGHDHQAMVGVSHERQLELERTRWSTKLRSPAAWSDAASYTMADITMLRRELLIGYGIAGFLAVMVPMDVWNKVFVTGHGFWTSLENVIVGPFIAFISFVCSIGNVPMAAALWHGGISFGGVISFIFADLIALPLVLIYRKYYGGRLTLRLFFWFWAVMSTAGLIVEGIFYVFGAIPTSRPETIVTTHFEWNYTTFLNIVFLGVLGVLYWLYRHRERLGGGTGYAFDPVCGMQVRTINAPARTHHHGQTYFFCSDHCRERFESDPARYAVHVSAPVAPGQQDHATATTGMSERGAHDPVCGMTVDPMNAAAEQDYEGRHYFFCGSGCAEAFAADPERYLTATPSDGDHRHH
jgi:YHS domain-containing protein/uncharacterized membrane protein YraQ (UPF0718 family)